MVFWSLTATNFARAFSSSFERNWLVGSLEFSFNLSQKFPKAYLFGNPQNFGLVTAPGHRPDVLPSRGRHGPFAWKFEWQSLMPVLVTCSLEAFSMSHMSCAP